MYLPGTKPPYGYIWAKADKSRLVEDPETAPVVIRIFELVASGVSARAVARLLTSERILAPRGGNYWQSSTIRRIIKSSLYYGVAVAFKVSTSYETRPGNVSGELVRRRVERPSELAVTLPEGTVPALVSEETAARALEYLKQHRDAPLSGRLSNAEVYLLRGGLATCSVCGSALTVRTRGKTPTTQSIYRCFTHIGDENPHGLGITTNELDDWAWSSFVEAVSSPEAIADTMTDLEERRAGDVMMQLIARQSLLDENVAQQSELVEIIKMMKHDGKGAHCATTGCACGGRGEAEREHCGATTPRRGVLFGL
jgi:hypothetical protein